MDFLLLFEPQNITSTSQNITFNTTLFHDNQSSGPHGEACGQWSGLCYSAFAIFGIAFIASIAKKCLELRFISQPQEPDRTIEP